MNSLVEKYGGMMKYWSQVGFAGVVCGWLFMVELPAMRKDANDREDRIATREEARMKDWREERRQGLSHAESAIGHLGGKLEDVARSVDRQTESFREVQAVTHKNQTRMIELQSKAMKEE